MRDRVPCSLLVARCAQGVSIRQKTWYWLNLDAPSFRDVTGGSRIAETSEANFSGFPTWAPLTARLPTSLEGDFGTEHPRLILTTCSRVSTGRHSGKYLNLGNVFYKHYIFHLLWFGITLTSNLNANFAKNRIRGPSHSLSKLYMKIRPVNHPSSGKHYAQLKVWN